jgi:hypothetical protein
MRAQWKQVSQDTPKKRAAREKKIRSAVDGRALKATGRTEQFNFKCRPELRTACIEAANQDGITIAEWLEGILEAALAARGK